MTNSFLPFHKPAIDKGEIASVTKAIRSGWLTRGPLTEIFEKKITNYVGAKYGIAMNSCTSALHISLMSHDIQAGDEIIVPTFTFAASANVIVHTGARPILADIEEDTCNISVQSIDDSITDRTKGIIPVDYGGHPCEIDKISKTARARGIFVFEDAAHAFDAKFRGTRIGTFADTTCFSFYATKNITTGEGGLLATQSKRISERARMLSLHGMSRDAWKRYTKSGNWYYKITEFGFKYNMSDVQAAIGMVQLKKATKLKKKRKMIAKLYSEELSKLDGITIPTEKSYVDHAWHLYPIRVNRHKTGVSRNKFIELLTEHNIGSSVHFIPLHLQPAYQKAFGYKKGDFPIAEKVFEEIVSLPIYYSMQENDVEKVVSVISDIIKA